MFQTLNNAPVRIAIISLGFIGSALLRLLIGQSDWHIVNIDKLTYAGNLESLADFAGHPRHVFCRTDICYRAA